MCRGGLGRLHRFRHEKVEGAEVVYLKLPKPSKIRCNFYSLNPSWSIAKNQRILILTYRNCPNNAPLAFWVDAPWYPLFPRTTNTQTAMRRMFANLTGDDL